MVVVFDRGHPGPYILQFYSYIYQTVNLLIKTFLIQNISQTSRKEQQNRYKSQTQSQLLNISIAQLIQTSVRQNQTFESQQSAYLMKSPKSSAQKEGQAKKKSGGQPGKKEAKPASAKASSKSQDNRSQGSEVNSQCRQKTQGKRARQASDVGKNERASGPAQGEQKEQKPRTSSDITSQSIAQKPSNENGANPGSKQQFSQQSEPTDNAGLVDPNNMFLQMRTASQMETQEQLTQQLQKLIENRGNHPTISLGPSSADYFINDYNVNVLPDRNPIQRVIEDFVSKRHAYQNFKVKDSGTSSSASASGVNAAAGQTLQQQRPPKPRLEEFLRSLQEHVFMVNKIYKVSKQQFEDDMKAFKNCENFDEEAEVQEQIKPQPQAWNLTDKQGDKTKKIGGEKDGGKESDNSHMAGQLLSKENHKVNEISDSQPSNDASDNADRKPQSQQGDNKEDESKQLAGQLVGQPPYYQPFQNPMQVPLNGALRSINNIMLTQQMNLISNPAQTPGATSGMAGQILQVPLSKKQQRSQTVQNFIQYLTEFYDGFESQANILQGYYPKHIQKCIQKKKSQNAERIAQSIKVPSFFNGGSSSKLSQKQMKSKAKKALHKMNLLTKFQATMMQVVLQKIDRRSKPIRKQTKIVTNSLNKKQIHLEEENFDILQLLRQNNQSKDKDGQGHSQNESKDHQKSHGDQKDKGKEGAGPPTLSSVNPGEGRIGGLNNITNLSEIDLSLIKGGSKTKNSAQAQQNDESEPAKKQLGTKKSRQDQRKQDREEKLKEKEKDRLRREAAKEDKKRKSSLKTERKEDDTDKPVDEPEQTAKNNIQDSGIGKKRPREPTAAELMTSPAYQGKLLKGQQHKDTAGADPRVDGSTFGLSCTAARKVQRPHMFNPYEVSSFHDKQRVEQALSSGDVLRPHRAGESGDGAPRQATSQQPLAEKREPQAAGPPAPGARHKQKHGRKQRKETLNLSKTAANQANFKGDEKAKRDDKVGSDGEHHHVENQQYIIGNNGAPGFGEYDPRPFSLQPAGPMGYNMHIGNVYYHQHHEHHHYGPPINHLVFGFPGSQQHASSFPAPPPGFYKPQIPGNQGLRLNSNGSKHSGDGKSPIDPSTDDMIIQPMQQQGLNTTPKSNLFPMSAAALGSGSNQALQPHRTHTQTFHHHHFHTGAFPLASHNKTASQSQLSTCPKPPRGPMTIQTNTGQPGSSVYSPDAKIVTSTTNNYDQHRNVGTTKFYQSVNQASAAMLCGGATGGFNHNISPSPQNNYKLGGGNPGIGLSAGNTHSKDGSSLINLQPCQTGVEYHTNVGPGHLSGISEFVLPLHPVPMNADKDMGGKETPAANNPVRNLSLHNQFRSMDIAASQPLFNQEAFSVAATAEFMNNSNAADQGRHEGARAPAGPGIGAAGQYSSVTPKSALLKHDNHFFPLGGAQSKGGQAAAGANGGGPGPNAPSAMLNIGAIPTPGVGASGSLSSLANVASLVQIVPAPKIPGQSATPSQGDSSLTRHRKN